MFEEVPGRTPVSQDALADGQKDEIVLKAAREMFPSVDEFETDDDRIFAFLCETARCYTRASHPEDNRTEFAIAMDLGAVIENVAPGYQVVQL